MAANLGLPEREVVKFIRKRWPKEKYEKIIGGKKASKNHQSPTSDFDLKKIISDNFNIIVFLSLLVLVCYFNAWGNDFVSDDIGNIKNNDQLGNFSYVFAQIVGTTQRFLYYLIYKTFGLNPASFRSLSILTHLLNTLSIFILLNLLTRRSVAFLASSLFAVHPILVESITWISGFPYSLHALFIILAFILYLKEKRIAATTFFLLALVSSEKAIIFPGIILILEMSRNNLKNNWKKTIPYFSIDLLFILFYISQIGRRISDISAVSYTDNAGFYNPLAQIPTAIANYFKLIVWPQALSLYQTEMSFSNIEYALFFLITFAYLALIFYGWKRNKILFFWLSFFIIALSPTLTPFKVSWVVAERYAYLGSIGIFVVIAMFFDWLIRKAGEKGDNWKIAAYSVFAIIIATFSVRTIARNIDWKNEDNLWIATGKVSPSGPNIHNNLGDVYARHKDFEKAAEQFKMAIAINPNYGDAYHNLGNTYNSMGKTDLAIENYEKALAINPNIWQSHQNLAAIYYKQGDFQKAMEHIKRAVAISPNDENLKKNMAMIEEKI
jgi:protein O-mannosyl-transferase